MPFRTARRLVMPVRPVRPASLFLAGPHRESELDQAADGFGPGDAIAGVSRPFIDGGYQRRREADANERVNTCSWSAALFPFNGN